MAGFMSVYTGRLTEKNRENYFKKLTLADGKQLPDPYGITGWEEDVTKWPDVQWPDIQLYLFEKPSVYTHEKLRAYKSMDAYNYVPCGHVQSIQHHDIDPEFCVLRSKVLPSQRQGHKTEMYDAWVIVNRKENSILTANCTCMAGSFSGKCRDAEEEEKGMIGQKKTNGETRLADVGLLCGSGSGEIHHHDVRIKAHRICRMTGHTQEVCGLKWSTDGRYLASGGKDNLVRVWPRVQEGGARNQRRSLHCWREHQGAVKALAWCPWRPNILPTGGGANDKHIRIWNVNSGSCVNSLDTQSQVSSMVFSPHYKEFVSAHGCDHNNVVIWKYPSLTKVAELSGHMDRILSMVLSPDESTVMTIAADENIRMWKIAELKKDKAMVASGGIHQLIR